MAIRLSHLILLSSKARKTFNFGVVDVQVDDQAVIHVWNNHGGGSSQLNSAMKVLFSTTAALNVLLL